LVDATTKAEDDVVIVDVVKVDAVVVVAAAAEDAVKVVVIVVVDVAEADEAVAKLHKVGRVSEVCLISLSRAGTNHHCGYNRRYRKNQNNAPHGLLLFLGAPWCVAPDPKTITRVPL